MDLRGILVFIQNHFPPWRQRAQRSQLKDADVERSLQRAKQSTDLAVEAIRDAYAVADARLHGA
jgi:hypothetical protein